MSPRSDRELYTACCKCGSEEQATAYTELHQSFFQVALHMVAGTHHPDPEALAADCAQETLWKIHLHLAEVQSPDSFRKWAARVLHNHVLNRLQQWRGEQAHAVRVPTEEDEKQDNSLTVQPDTVFANVENAELAVALGAAITAADLSDRSRWVVAGRYLLEMEDQVLAAQLTEREGSQVLSNHVQTTRSKNLAKLRKNAQACSILAPWLG